MRKISYGVGLLAAVLVLGACTPENPRFAFKTAERRGVLKSNGLRFVIMPDSTTELVEVDVHYEVGAAEDPIGKAGLAHTVEHLMFQMRPDGPNTPPIFQTLLDLATFVNAFTSWDMTHYWTTVRAENFDSMMKIEAMRMFFAADLPGSGVTMAQLAWDAADLLHRQGVTRLPEFWASLERARPQRVAEIRRVRAGGR